MPINEIKHETERRMQASIDALRTELKHLRTGRASIALLEGIHRRVLRDPDPSESGGQPVRSRRDVAPGSALGARALSRPSRRPIRTSDLGLESRRRTAG